VLDVTLNQKCSKLLITTKHIIISPAQLEKFKQIYKAKFDKDINDQEAYEKGIKLIQLLKINDKPISEEDYKAAKTLIALLNYDDDK